jgi:hypothetical protein
VNKLLLKTAAACCIALALTACGTRGSAGNGEDAPKLRAAADGGTASGTVSPTERAALELNERGFIVKGLGEQACFGDAGANCAGGVSFSIDQVDVDPPCAEFGSHPDNGHTLVLHLRVATGDDADVVDEVGGIINPFSFVEIGADGVTRDVSFGMCVDPATDRLPDAYGPNQRYQGVMDLEVRDASGTIALQFVVPQEDGLRGWEWTYPTS